MATETVSTTACLGAVTAVSIFIASTMSSCAPFSTLSPGSTRMIVAGTYAANYKARGLLKKSGYRPAADSEFVLRTYYDIPDDRLRGSIAYVKGVGSHGR